VAPRQNREGQPGPSSLRPTSPQVHPGRQACHRRRAPRLAKDGPALGRAPSIQLKVKTPVMTNFCLRAFNGSPLGARRFMFASTISPGEVLNPKNRAWKSLFQPSSLESRGSVEALQRPGAPRGNSRRPRRRRQAQAECLDVVARSAWQPGRSICGHRRVEVEAKLCARPRWFKSPPQPPREGGSADRGE